jgi:hypothetical protein
MEPSPDPPQPGQRPPEDPALERLHQFEQSRGLPPSWPGLDPHDAPPEPAPAEESEDDDPPSHG